MSWRRMVSSAMRAALLLAAAALVACAVPQWQKPGTDASQIAHDMGQPDVRVALSEGGERWIYSYQPAGQQVYHMVFDAQMQLLHVEQVLQPTHFHRLRVGEDTHKTVFEYFGKPALIEHVANFQGDIWTYRFHENSFDR